MISKSYDCFAPVSKFIPKTEVPDCHNLDLWMTVNGKMIQKGNTKMMIHTVGQRKKQKRIKYCTLCYLSLRSA